MLSFHHHIQGLGLRYLGCFVRLELAHLVPLGLYLQVNGGRVRGCEFFYRGLLRYLALRRAHLLYKLSVIWNAGVSERMLRKKLPIIPKAGYLNGGKFEKNPLVILIPVHPNGSFQKQTPSVLVTSALLLWFWEELYSFCLICKSKYFLDKR